MLTMLEPEVTLLTPEVAQKIQSMPGLLGERELRPSRLAFHLNNLKHNMFFSPNWVVAKDKSTGSWYRVNGQHTSTMLTTLAPDDPEAKFPSDADDKPMRLVITRWEMGSHVDDAFRLFKLYDNPKCGRTNEDTMGYYRALHEDLKSLPNKFLIKVCNGIDNFWAEKMDVDASCRGLYLGELRNRAFAFFLWGFNESKHAEFLTKPGIVAEAYADWGQDIEMAEEFWAHVFREDHPDADDLTRDLIRELQKYFARPPKGKEHLWRSKTATAWKRYRKLRIAETRLSPPPAVVDSGLTAIA